MSFVPSSKTADFGAKADSIASRSSPVAEDWFFKIIGEELGPFTFQEIVSFVEQGQLHDETEVKIGVHGTWNRVDCVAQLVEARQARESQDTTSAQLVETSAATPDLSLIGATTEDPLVRPAVEQSIEAQLDKAQTAHAAFEQATKHLLITAFGFNTDANWYGWISGVQYGPVDFGQLVGWLTEGRLRSTDYVRYGIQGTYAPVGIVPGLLHTINILGQATEVLHLAKTLASTAAIGQCPVQFPLQPVSAFPTAQAIPTIPPAVTTMPAVSASASNVTAAEVAKPITPTASESAPIKPPVVDSTPVPTVKAEQPVDAPLPITYGKPESAPDSGFSSIRKPSIARPVASKTREPARQSGKSAQFSVDFVIEKLKEPRVMIGIGSTIAAILLLIVWQQWTPVTTAADIERYRAVKQLLDDVRAMRTANAADFADLKKRAEKLRVEYVPVLQKEADKRHPARQALLWAVQEDLPLFMKQKLQTESKAEKQFGKHLEEVAKMMKIAP